MDPFINKDCDPSNQIKDTKSRRRAARACMTCRARKVRCDVSEKWPCGNCTWDYKDCVVRGRRVKRFALPSSAGGYGQHRPTSSQAAKRPQLTMSRTDPSESKPRRAIYEPFEPPERTLTSSAHFSPQRELFDVEPRIQLQAFLKPLPARIKPGDVAYLISQGALSLPDVKSQTALIRAYFEFTYPYMPILDIRNFLGALTNQDERLGQVSLFLFQVILFSGAAHVQLDCLRAAGFATRKQAREELFRRVRLLYDFNYESDPFVLVQGLLLMSLCYDNAEDHRNTWHWVDVAFSQAFICQLNQDSDHSQSSVNVRKLRRRVWWSCFIRDQLTSVEMKRLPRIRDGEYDVPPLDDDDFDFEDVHPEFATIWRAMCPFIGEKPKQRDMATLFIAKTNLCHILAEFSFLCHSINSKNSGNDQLPSLKRKLEGWNEALPDCCRHGLYKKMNISENTGIEWNAMGLQIMYHSLVLAMERTSATSSLPQEEFDQETAEVCMPGESNVELEGLFQGTQFMKPPENTNKPTELAWVSPELAASSYADFDELQLPGVSGWQEPLQGENHVPGQQVFSNVAADECSEIELAEDEQDGSLTSESLNGTSTSEASTIADCGFEALGYGDIAEAMFFDKNFQFCSIELDALFSPDGEVVVK